MSVTAESLEAPPTAARFAPRLTAGYLFRGIIRVLIVALLGTALFSLLGWLRLVDDSRNGMAPADSAEMIGTIVETATHNAWPILIILAIADLQLFIWRSGGLSLNSCLVLFPLALAAAGAVFGYAALQHPDIPVGIATRLYVLGGALTLYLTGSFHVWLWQTIERDQPVETTPLWYLGSLCLSGAFLGTMIAWDAPSPLEKVVQDYYRQRWEDRPGEPLPDNLLESNPRA